MVLQYHMCSKQRNIVGMEEAVMTLDPVATDPDHYKVIFENDRVRVLEYTDSPVKAPAGMPIRIVSCTR